MSSDTSSPGVTSTAQRLLRSVVAAAACIFTLTTPLRAQSSWPLWESYGRSIIDQQGRVIDHAGQDRTTSEGQAYAMFFALVANDRERFDQLLKWTEINLGQGDLSQHLPAWNWGKGPDGEWKQLDANPASDADLWMAYDLIEAGRLWKEPRYDHLGHALAAQIAQHEAAYIPGLGTTLLPGPHGFRPDQQTWLLNPGYIQPSILARLSVVMSSGPWVDLLASLTPILAQGSGAGYAMDWVQAGQGVHPAPNPAQFEAGDAGAMPIGGYEAIRVYLWLGIADPDTRGVRTLLGHVTSMADYLDGHPMPPQKVDATGKVINPNSSPGFSAAVIPYLRAVGRGQSAKQQLDRLNASRDAGTGLYGKNADYYDQNLVMFATGWLEGRYRFDRNGMLRVKWK